MNCKLVEFIFLSGHASQCVSTSCGIAGRANLWLSHGIDGYEVSRIRLRSGSTKGFRPFHLAIASAFRAKADAMARRKGLRVSIETRDKVALKTGRPIWYGISAFSPRILVVSPIQAETSPINSVDEA